MIMDTLTNAPTFAPRDFKSALKPIWCPGCGDYGVVQAIYRDFFASVQAGLVVEQSHQGQLYRIIRMFIDMPPGVASMVKSGANPILVSEVLARVRQLAMELQRRHAPELQVDA